MRVAHRGQQSIRRFFLPDRPGPQTALQAVRTGEGSCHVDRWPDPTSVIVAAGHEMVVAGDPARFTPQELLTLGFRGLIEAPVAFEPLLKSAYADLRRWPRVIGTLAGGDAPAPPPGFALRKLTVRDASLARAINPDARWIWSHAASVEERLSRGDVWGALAMEGRLASVALPFTIGDRYEDIGVFTEPRDRRAGLSTACAAALVRDVTARGRIASWSTTPDNLASLRVAGKLAFRRDREDVLYVAGIEVPTAE
jgi:hypothetical protein